MKNMDEVRAALSATYTGVKAGKLEPGQAREMNSACGKIINTVRTELEYFALLKKAGRIPFLENGKAKVLPAAK